MEGRVSPGALQIKKEEMTWEQLESEVETEQVQCLGSPEKQVFQEGGRGPCLRCCWEEVEDPLPCLSPRLATVLTSRNTTCMTEPVSHTGHGEAQLSEAQGRPGLPHHLGCRGLLLSVVL